MNNKKWWEQRKTTVPPYLPCLGELPFNRFEKRIKSDMHYTLYVPPKLY